jgi:hypothetical protein
VLVGWKFPTFVHVPPPLVETSTPICALVELFPNRENLKVMYGVDPQVVKFITGVVTLPAAPAAVTKLIQSPCVGSPVR